MGGAAVRIAEEAEYEGVRVRFRGHPGTAEVGMQIAMGFGAAVVGAGAGAVAVGFGAGGGVDVGAGALAQAARMVKATRMRIMARELATRIALFFISTLPPYCRIAQSQIT